PLKSLDSRLAAELLSLAGKCVAQAILRCQLALSFCILQAALICKFRQSELPELEMRRALIECDLPGVIGSRNGMSIGFQGGSIIAKSISGIAGAQPLLGTFRGKQAREHE